MNNHPRKKGQPILKKSVNKSGNSAFKLQQVMSLKMKMRRTRRKKKNITRKMTVMWKVSFPLNIRVK
jgi:hypothetical protein